MFNNRLPVLILVFGATLVSTAFQVVDVLFKDAPVTNSYSSVTSAHICLTQPQLRQTSVCKGTYK